MTSSASCDLQVGIHLTADYAVVALGDEAAPRVLPNSAGSLFTPAAVSVDQRGRLRVGGEAWARAAAGTDPNAVADLLGRLDQGAEGGHDFGQGRDMRAAELMAELLKSLRTDFRATTGDELSAAALAIPSDASEQVKTSLREAATLVGMESVHFVPEPVAASFGIDLGQRSAGGGTMPTEWLVCQAEDGGFSASLLRREDDEITVAAHVTRASVNGDTLNQRIARDYVAGAAWADDLEWDDMDASARVQLLLNVEDAKRDVWRMGTSAEVFIEGLRAKSDTDPLEIDFEVTPDLLEQACREELTAAMRDCRELMAEADTPAKPLDTIVLVGACAVDPALRSALTEAFGIAPLVDPDPRTVVARGATVWAASRGNPTRQGEQPEGVGATPAQAAPSDSVEIVDPLPASPAPSQSERPEPRPSIDPARMVEVRADLRAQRRRLLAIHAQVTRTGETEDRTLAIAVAGLVRSRQYERVDALFLNARAGEPVSETELSGAIAELTAALDELEAIR